MNQHKPHGCRKLRTCSGMRRRAGAGSEDFWSWKGVSEAEAEKKLALLAEWVCTDVNKASETWRGRSLRRYMSTKPTPALYERFLLHTCPHGETHVGCTFLTCE